MSCYEWEEGTIRLPTKTYANFRQSIIAEWNKWEERCFEEAQKYWEYLKKHKKKAPSCSHHEPYTAWIYRETMYCECLQERVFQLCRGKEHKPERPMKKKLTVLPASRAADLWLGEGRISFNDKAHSVRWVVMENNHACEHARTHPVAQAFFSLLGKIHWTRGSGGQIVGNNE